MSLDRLIDKLLSAKGTASTRLLLIASLMWSAWRVTEVEKDVEVIKYQLRGSAHPGASPLAAK